MSIWAGHGDARRALNLNDGQAIELGVKFRSSQAGYITAIRFYKGNQDTGTHVGHLWTADGHAPGLGHVHRRDGLGLAGGGARRRPSRSPPNTTYVASYHSSPGYYVASDGLLRAGRRRTAR